MSGVEIRVRSNSREARNDLRKLEKSVGNIETAANRMSSAFKNAAITLGGALITGKLTKGFVTAADSVNQLANRVALVTGRGKELQGTLVSLYAISARSRTSVGTTTEVFNRFSLALRGSGKSADQILKVTEAVGKASVLSGASADSARAAIIQLGQGLAAGELRGEELNSVLEQTPRVAQAIADGLGVPFGQLKSLAKDGKITAEAVFNALISQADALNEEFKLIKPTIQDLTVVMRDEFTRALAEIDTALGFSDSVARKVEALTSVFRYVADNAQYRIDLIKLYFNDLGFFVSNTVSKISKAFGSMFSLDFDVETFRNQINEALAEVKNFLGFSSKAGEEESPLAGIFDFNITVPDYASFTKGLSGTVGVIQHFAQVIKDTFDGIYDYVFANSPWPDMFNEKGILSPEWKAAMDNFINTILVPFKDNVINKFKEMYRDVKNWFVKLRAEFTAVDNEAGDKSSGGFMGLKSASEQLDKVLTNLTTTATKMKNVVADSRIWKQNAETISTKYAAIAGYAEGIKTDFEINDKFSEKMKNAFGSVKADSKEAAKVLKASLGDFLLGEGFGVDASFIGPLPDGEEVGKLGGLLGGVMDNSGTILGVSAAAAFAYAFPNATLGALEYAGLGIALAFANGLSFALSGGLPITLAIAAIVFPEGFAKFISSDIFQGTVRAIGTSLGESIRGLFEDGNSPLFEAIGSSIENFGDAISDAIIGDDWGNSFTDKMAGAIAIAVGVFVIGGVLRNGLIGFGIAIAKTIFAGSGATLAIQNGLSLSIADGTDKVGKDIETGKGKAGKSMLKLGRMLGGALNKGFNAALLAQAANEGVDYIAGFEEDGLGDAATDIASGAVTGAVIGSAIPVIGTSIGAVVGGLSVALYKAFTNEKVQEGIKQVSSWMDENFLTPFKDKWNAFWDGLNDDPSATPEVNQANDLEREAKGIREQIAATSVAMGLVGDNTVDAHDILKDYSSKLETWNTRLKEIDSEHAQLLSEDLDNKREYNDAMQVAITNLSKASAGLDAAQIDAFIKSTDTSGSPIKKASGGYISGPGGPTEDKIPAMLSNGEYVIKASSVRKFGPDFLSKINAGIMPQLYGDGGLVERIAMYKSQEQDMLGKAGGYRMQAAIARKSGDAESVSHFDAQMTIAEQGAARARSAWEALESELSRDTSGSGAGAATLAGGGDKSTKDKKKDAAKSQAEGFVQDIKTSFSNALKTGDIKGFFTSIADSFTSRIIDSFSNSFIDSLLGEKGEGFLTKIFKGSSDFGGKVGSKTTDGIKDAFAGGEGGGEGLLSGIGGFFKGFGEKISGLFSGIFGGGSGGGGGLLSSLGGLFGGGGGGGLFSMIGGFFGMNSGGIVPTTPYSKTGIDSVPTMLTPGELVVPANKVDQFVQGAAKGGQSVFNINVSGDVTRQTRKEVAKMIPEITAGVNMTNKERRGR